MNIFERAARTKLRFQSPMGLLTVEDLWDIPLTAKRTPSIEALGTAVMVSLKARDGTTFLSDKKSDPVKVALQLQYDILRHVADAKTAEADAAEKRMARAADRRILRDALADKASEAIRAMSAEDIQKKLKELGDEEEADQAAA